MFSRTTTELSIKRENASARPLKTMLLIVAFPAWRTKDVAITDSGMDKKTAAVARGLPKKIKIKCPCEQQANSAFAQYRRNCLFHENRLIENDVRLQLRRNIPQSQDRFLECRLQR